ncbi:MAG TPA: polyprenyl synthetase family protein [Verrucomicrobiae bacterium]
MLVPDEKANGPLTATMTPPQPLADWRLIVAPVQPFLSAVTVSLGQQVEAFDAEIAPYAKYALTNQGKHLRPALVALSGGAIQPNHHNEDLVTVAVIIEMIHLATLVHDDIMDMAEMRRQRPTLAANWGNQISVLLGDCLFAHALKLAASFPTTEVCRAVSSSTNTVCSGEILQTHRRGKLDMSRAEYFKILSMKTGELFALSCDLGAHLSNATPTQRRALRDYGMALGTAYQIYDDCVDLFDSEDRAGKSLGTDLASGKVTLPLLSVLEKCTPAERTQLERWLQAWKPEYQSGVTTLLERYDSLTISQQVIEQHLFEARQQLKTLPPTPGRQALQALTDFLAQQTNGLGVTA